MKGDPEETIRRPQMSSLLLSSVDGYLLTQGSILKSQACPRHQCGPHESEQSR
jgi:hypothetical protein